MWRRFAHGKGSRKGRRPADGKARGKGRRPASFLVDDADAGASDDNLDVDLQEEGAPSAEPTRIEEAQLTPEQRRAAQRALSGESLFLTGAAGTGKSFLLRYIVQELELKYPGQVGVTASTGIAAANIGGQTVHSFGGVGLGVGPVRKLIGQVKKSSQAVERWTNARVLVLDEISMLDGDLFCALDAIASSVRERKGVSFGGLQLLLCGDFLQLPPVQGRGESPKKFCFETPSWAKAGLCAGTVVLQESVRQAGDSTFAQVLNEVRVGNVSERAEALLAKCHVSVKAAPKDGIVPTKLYCLNRNVDAENAARLAKLPGAACVLRAKDHFKGVRDSARRQTMSSLLDKKVPAELKLKVGAQVILIKNNPTLNLVNGSRGRVESFQQGRPVVRFDTGRSVCVGIERFTHGTGSTSLLRLQVPLKLGWALTVHKAQGMTLTRAELQVDQAFEAGQTYVALSRLTSTEGLWIRGGGLSQSNTRAHLEVLRFYQASAQRPNSTTTSPTAPAWGGHCSELLPASVAGKVAAPVFQPNTAATPSSLPPQGGCCPELLPVNVVQELPGPQRKRSASASPPATPKAAPKAQRRSASREAPPPSNWVSPPKTWGGIIELD